MFGFQNEYCIDKEGYEIHFDESFKWKGFVYESSAIPSRTIGKINKIKDLGDSINVVVWFFDDPIFCENKELTFSFFVKQVFEGRVLLDIKSFFMTNKTNIPKLKDIIKL